MVDLLLSLTSLKLKKLLNFIFNLYEVYLINILVVIYSMLKINFILISLCKNIKAYKVSINKNDRIK